jgi:hypothetical protein
MRSWPARCLMGSVASCMVLHQTPGYALEAFDAVLSGQGECIARGAVSGAGVRLKAPERCTTRSLPDGSGLRDCAGRCWPATAGLPLPAWDFMDANSCYLPREARQ